MGTKLATWHTSKGTGKEGKRRRDWGEKGPFLLPFALFFPSPPLPFFYASQATKILKTTCWEGLGLLTERKPLPSFHLSALIQYLHFYLSLWNLSNCFFKPVKQRAKEWASFFNSELQMAIKTTLRDNLFNRDRVIAWSCDHLQTIVYIKTSHWLVLNKLEHFASFFRRFESISSIFLRVLEIEIRRNNSVITEHQLTLGHICNRLYVYV